MIVRFRDRLLHFHIFLLIQPWLFDTKVVFAFFTVRQLPFDSEVVCCLLHVGRLYTFTVHINNQFGGQRAHLDKDVSLGSVVVVVRDSVVYITHDLFVRLACGDGLDGVDGVAGLDGVD